MKAGKLTGVDPNATTKMSDIDKKNFDLANDLLAGNYGTEEQVTTANATVQALNTKYSQPSATATAPQVVGKGRGGVEGGPSLSYDASGQPVYQSTQGKAQKLSGDPQINTAMNDIVNFAKEGRDITDIKAIFAQRYPNSVGALDTLLGGKTPAKESVKKTPKAVTKVEQNLTIGEVGKVLIDKGISIERAEKVAKSNDLWKPGKEGQIIDIESFKKALEEVKILDQFTADQITSMLKSIWTGLDVIGDKVIDLKIPGTSQLRK